MIILLIPSLKSFSLLIGKNTLQLQCLLKIPLITVSQLLLVVWNNGAVTMFTSTLSTQILLVLELNFSLLLLTKS